MRWWPRRAIPQLFDGYLVGAPGYRLPLAAVANMHGAQQCKQVATDPKDLATAFTRGRASHAWSARCSSAAMRSTALRDGMVQDAAACSKAFDLARDVPTCSGGAQWQLPEQRSRSA